VLTSFQHTMWPIWGTSVEHFVKWCPTPIHERSISRLLQDAVNGEPLSTFVARQSPFQDKPYIVIEWRDGWIVDDGRQRFAQLQAEYRASLEDNRCGPHHVLVLGRRQLGQSIDLYLLPVILPSFLSLLLLL